DGDATTRRRAARVGRSAADPPAGYAGRRRHRATVARSRLGLAPRTTRAVVGTIRGAKPGGAAGRIDTRSSAAAPASLLQPGLCAAWRGSRAGHRTGLGAAVRTEPAPAAGSAPHHLSAPGAVRTRLCGPPLARHAAGGTPLRQPGHG